MRGSRVELWQVVENEVYQILVLEVCGPRGEPPGLDGAEPLTDGVHDGRHELLSCVKVLPDVV